MINTKLIPYYDSTTNSTVIPDRAMPFFLWAPFDYVESPIYEIMFFYSLLCPWVFGLYVGTLDLMITGFIAHINAQYLILKNSLSMYVEKGEEAHVSITLFR